MQQQDGRSAGAVMLAQSQAYRDGGARPSMSTADLPASPSAGPASGSHHQHQQQQQQQYHQHHPNQTQAVGSTSGHLPAIPSDPSAKEQQAAAKQSLKQWWTKFTKQQQQQQQSGYGKKDDTSPTNSGKGVFGVPLTESLKYAGVAISMVGPDGVNQVYGYIPIVVAKCGLFLKQKATTVEGVFRISGSTRRMKELQDIFDKPPSYGRDVVWGPWSVHDAASVLRRYLNQMPEPVVPYELYDEFRNALPPLDKVKDPAAINASIQRYKALIACLPSSSKYLLCYVLDLLNVFSRHHAQNLMPAANLAVVFQPGLIRAPDSPLLRAMPLPGNTDSGPQSSEEALMPPNLPQLSRASSNPLSSRPMTASSTNESKTNSTELRRQQDEIKINQEVLEFLINHQDHFVALPDFSSSTETSPVSPASGSGQSRGSAPAAASKKPQQPASKPQPVQPQPAQPAPAVSRPSAQIDSPRLAQPIQPSRPPATSSQAQQQATMQQQIQSTQQQTFRHTVPVQQAPQPRREEPSNPASPTPFRGQEAQRPSGRASPLLQSQSASRAPQAADQIQLQPGRASPVTVLGQSQSQKPANKAAPKSKDLEKQKDDRKPRKLKKGRTPTGSGASTPLSPNAVLWDSTQNPLPPAQYSHPSSPYHSNSTPPAHIYDEDTPLSQGMDAGPGVKRSRTLPSPGDKGAAVRRVSGRRGSDSRAAPSATASDNRLSIDGRPTTAPSPLRSPIPRGVHSPSPLASPAYLGTSSGELQREQSDSSDAQAGPSDHKKGAGWRRAFKKEKEHSLLQIPGTSDKQSAYSGTSTPSVDEHGRKGSLYDSAVSVPTRRPSTSSAAARTDNSEASERTQLRAVRNPPLHGHGKEGSGSMSKRDARKAAQQTPEFSPDAIRDAVTNIGR